MTMKTHGVPLHRLVRLRDAVRGQYCQFEKGEVVKLSGELDRLRMERVKWRNSLTISNVLCNVPDWLILYDDAEEPNAPETKQAEWEGRLHGSQEWEDIWPEHDGQMSYGADITYVEIRRKGTDALT